MTDVTDPVCGMTIELETAEDLGAILLDHDGETKVFCCPTCAAQFKADPAKYA